MLEGKNIESLRKKTLIVLEENFTHGIIDVDEYEKRVDIALNTSIEEDLVRLTSDLTVVPEETLSGGQPNQKGARRIPVHAKEEDLIAGILSSISRKAVARAPRTARPRRMVSTPKEIRVEFPGCELPSHSFSSPPHELLRKNTAAKVAALSTKSRTKRR